MLAAFLEDVTEAKQGFISPRRMSRALRMPIADLSRVTHLHRNTLTNNPRSDKVQARLGEIARIIVTAADLTGDVGRAIVWFRHQPIAAFGQRTAQELVMDGHADAVLKHLDTLADGGYA
jgi:uncharacterized protein (DUF2384 family)